MTVEQRENNKETAFSRRGLFDITNLNKTWIEKNN